jgi:hypothetical protein
MGIKYGFRLIFQKTLGCLAGLGGDPTTERKSKGDILQSS